MAAAAAPILAIRISDGRPSDSGLGDGGPYDDGRGSRRPGNASTLHLHFSHSEVGEADSARPLGWIVATTAIRRASLDGALALADRSGANIDLRAPGDLVDVTRHSGGVTERLRVGRPPVASPKPENRRVGQD